MDGFPDLVVPSCAVVLADDHTCTGGKTQEEADEHIDDGADGAHRGVSGVADIVAYHPGVNGVIQLLEQISDEQRNSKGDDMAENIAFGHIYIPAGLKPQREFALGWHDKRPAFQNLFLL